MGRWEPDAESRLRGSALELFVEQGYEQTSVADIARRAGLTPRTFFRYFSDKAEVLFNGTERLQQTLLEALAQVPPEAPALQAIEQALARAEAVFDEALRPLARLRNQVVLAHSDLHERELIKLARLSAALAEGLRARGLPEADARLVAETGMAVFRVAFAQWVGETETQGYGEIVRDAFSRLRRLGG